MLEDIIVQAYLRAVQSGCEKPLPHLNYSRLFTVNVPEVSRADNASLAHAARDLAESFRLLQQTLPGRSRSLAELMLRQVMQVSGKPLDDLLVEQVINEGFQTQKMEEK
jgi:hypothetical protein